MKLIDFLSSSMKSEDLDFIAIIVTPWHALGAQAFVEGLQAKSGKNLKGLVIIEEHARDGFVLEDKDVLMGTGATVRTHCFKARGQEPFFQRIAYHGNILKGLLSIQQGQETKKRIYIISPLRVSLEGISCFAGPSIARKYFPIFVRIDEGIGMCFSPKVFLLESLPKTGIYVKDVLARLKSCVPRVISKLAKNILVGKNAFIERRLFYGTNPGLRVAKDVADSYLKLFREKKQEDILGGGEKSILLLTQPFVKAGIVGQEQVKEVFEKVVEAAKSTGKKVAIKVHPRDDRWLYAGMGNVTLIDVDCPVEEIMGKGVDAVVGFTSTSLINAKILFGIKSISVCEFLLNKSESEYFRRSSGEFKRMTENFIEFPRDAEELRNVLK